MSDETTPNGAAAAERPRLTLDDILADMAKIARSGEDENTRLRALRALHSVESVEAGTSRVELPPPLSPGEVVDRLARVMRPCGDELVRLAYRKAFPRSKREATDTPDASEALLTPEQLAECSKIVTVKRLYRRFRSLARGGTPRGYPLRGSRVVQEAWCKRAAVAEMIEELRTKGIAR